MECERKRIGVADSSPTLQFEPYLGNVCRFFRKCYKTSASALRECLFKFYCRTKFRNFLRKVTITATIFTIHLQNNL